jgi:hypothetical protein
MLFLRLNTRCVQPKLVWRLLSSIWGNIPAGGRRLPKARQINGSATAACDEIRIELLSRGTFNQLGRTPLARNPEASAFCID